MEVRTPSPEELNALRGQVADGPVVLVNLVKFREPAGSARFAEYGAAIGPMFEKAGTEIVYAAPAGPSLSGVDWDYVILVRFPSIDVFIEVIGRPHYQNEAGPIREAALERAVWLVTQPSTSATE